MPYSRIRELPKNVRDLLPEQAQKLYRKTFNQAWESYGADSNGGTGVTDAQREENAHRVAWAAVKQSFEKNPNSIAPFIRDSLPS